MEDGAASGTRSVLSESKDESYCPSMSVHSNDSYSVSLVDSEEESEVEDCIRVDDVDVVIDHFDAFDGPIGDDQCNNFDNYLAKLYRNGELYIDKGFGNVMIKEWQLLQTSNI